MTARVYLSAVADADFAAIIDFLSVYAGRSTAVKYRNLFRELFQRLSDLPESGPRRRILGRDVRIGVVRPYVVLYRYTSDTNTVFIMRIVHGRRRITGNLLRRTEP